MWRRVGVFSRLEPCKALLLFHLRTSYHSMISAQTSFIPRHIGPNAADTAAMLAAIGFDSLDAMTEAIVPAASA